MACTQKCALNFFIEGGTVERRKEKTYKRNGGEIAFYHEGEAHMNAETVFPSKSLNVEMDSGFLKKYAAADSTTNEKIFRIIKPVFSCSSYIRSCSGWIQTIRL